MRNIILASHGEFSKGLHPAGFSVFCRTVRRFSCGFSHSLRIDRAPSSSAAGQKKRAASDTLFVIGIVFDVVIHVACFLHRENHTGLNGTGTTYAGMKVDALTALPHRMRPDSEDFGKNIRIL